MKGEKGFGEEAARREWAGKMAEKTLERWNEESGKVLDDSQTAFFLGQLIELLMSSSQSDRSFNRVPMLNFVDGKASLSWPDLDKEDGTFSVPHLWKKGE